MLGSECDCAVLPLPSLHACQAHCLCTAGPLERVLAHLIVMVAAGVRTQCLPPLEGQGLG